MREKSWIHLVRCGMCNDCGIIHSLGIFLNTRMHLNDQGVHVTPESVVFSMLQSLVHKRGGSNEISHGKYHSSYIRPCWLGNGLGSAQRVVNDIFVRFVWTWEAVKHQCMLEMRLWVTFVTIIITVNGSNEYLSSVGVKDRLWNRGEFILLERDDTGQWVIWLYICRYKARMVGRR